MEKEDSKVYFKDNLKEVRNRLYKCRDLEISNLWQRSVFLSVFLILCFTGYGYLLLEIVESYFSFKYPILNLIAVALGSVGFIFSCIWIMMAKGSKAWYEVYEKAIKKFEEKFAEQLMLPNEFMMGEMNAITVQKDNSIFSTKAGGYSVSKINIAIGQLCFCIWILIALFHAALNIINLFQKSHIEKIDVIVLLFSVIIPIISFIVFVKLVCCRKWVQSGFLNSEGQQSNK